MADAGDAPARSMPGHGARERDKADDFGLVDDRQRAGVQRRRGARGRRPVDVVPRERRASTSRRCDGEIVVEAGHDQRGGVFMALDTTIDPSGIADRGADGRMPRRRRRPSVPAVAAPHRGGRSRRRRGSAGPACRRERGGADHHREDERREPGLAFEDVIEDEANSEELDEGPEGGDDRCPARGRPLGSG